MPKTLRIEANDCKVSTNKWKDLYINGEDIKEMIFKSLPALEENKEYPAAVSIVIEVKDVKEIVVITEGYELPHNEVAEEKTENIF